MPSVVQTPQVTVFTSSATPSLAYTSAVTKGDLLVNFVSPNTTTTTLSAAPTDTVGTAYTIIANLAQTGLGNTYLCAGIAPASGANTVSFSLSVADTGGIYLVDANGLTKTFEGAAGNIFNFVSVATTNPKTNSLTTSNPGDLLIAILNSATGNITAGQAGWTDIISTNAFRALQYFIPGATGIFQPGWTMTSGTAVAAIVAFTPPSAGGPGGSLAAYNFWGGGFN